MSDTPAHAAAQAAMPLAALHVVSLHIYPIKSCAGLSLASAEVDALGLAHDRRWVLTDPDGRFVTGRQEGRLVLVRAEPDTSGLRLSAPGMPDLDVPVPAADAPRANVQVWKDAVDAAHAGAAADAWFGAYLGRPLRLWYFDARSRRAIDPDYARSGEQVAFADGYPLLAISQASLDQLNARLPAGTAPLSMLRFRPNVVIAGAVPHAEDAWRRVRIGGVVFDAVKPCTRCVFTSVDPATGLRDPQGEPLTTLKSYRRAPAGITFGMNLIPRGAGTLRAGDDVVVEA